MHPAIKLIVGVIIFLIGIYWYAAPLFGHMGLQNFFKTWTSNAAATGSTFSSFVLVFAGLFGLVLIGLGLIIAWIEYEDLKWERKEKKE